ncbi:MAG TPA: hypothetical protein VF272_04130 [Candidatus Saccharimonadia bacterium]
MKLFRLSLFALLLICTSLGLSNTAHAVDYSNSNMMDDQIFDNTGSMSEAQIQSFLASKGPCLPNFQTPNFYFDGTSWHYGDISSTTPPSDSVNYPHRWQAAFGPATIGASTAIYKASRQWGLNPQVILATLQKESSLVAGTACDGWRYNSAMGYGCPDSGGCNAKYVGFTRQVLWGSWQLKFNKERAYGNTAWDGDDAITYVGYMTEGDRRRCGTCPLVHYDGNATIDGQQIHIENGTTASLFTYTPHLNQSFPGIFESWFGSVRGITYAWSYAGQTTNKSLTSIRAGETATFTVSARNTGFNTWTNSGPNPVRLGASRPNDRSSIFATNTWVSPARPATLKEASVAPGGTGTFTFTVKMPATGGNYREYFNLLVEGKMWLNDPGLYYDITVIPDVYSWSRVGQAVYANSSKAAPVDAGNLSPGQTVWFVLVAKNTGNTAWLNSGTNPVRLGTEGPKDRHSRYVSPGWLGQSRPANLSEATVAVGANGTFEFPVTVPAGGGTFIERFNLVAEGVDWMNDVGLSYFTRVNHGYSWSLISQYAYTNSAKTTPINLANLTPGQNAYVGIVARNTGSSTWYRTGAYPIDLGTSRPLDRISAFTAAGWLGGARPARMVETAVAPGQNATFEFNFNASAAGTYREYFTPVAEGITWMNDIGLNFYSVVH